MITAIIISFGCTILLGMVLLSYVLRDKPIPKAIAFIHGPLAVLSLILLIVYNFLNLTPLIVVTVMFIVAAFGGFFLIYRDMRGKRIPKGVAILHGVLAIVSFILLLIFSLVVAK